MSSKVTPDKKVDIFKAELDLIFSDTIRQFTEICLIYVKRPPCVYYNWNAISSVQ